MTIVDDIAEIEEFAQGPWTSGQLAGQVVFGALQQTAGRRAVLRDRNAFPVFVDAVRAVEAAVRRATDKLAEEIDARTADRLAETLRRVFGRVLKELADLDNPMRTPVGDEPGVGGLFEPARAEGPPASPNGSTGPKPPSDVPGLEEFEQSAGGAPVDPPRREARPDRRRVAGSTSPRRRRRGTPTRPARVRRRGRPPRPLPESPRGVW